MVATGNMSNPPETLPPVATIPCADHDDPNCEACIRGEDDPHCEFCNDTGFVTHGPDDVRCECNVPSAEPEDYLDADDGADIEF